MQTEPTKTSITYVRPEWKIWHSFLILALIMAVGLILSLFEGSVQRPIGYLLLFNLLQFACFFLVPIYIAGVRYQQPCQVLGIRERPLEHGLGKALRWGVSLFALNASTALILLILFPDRPQELQMVIQAMLKDANTFELAGLIFCVTVLAPVGEEIFFRAFLFGVLESRFGRWVGIIVSAAVFAAMHEGIWNFLPIFVGGCGFAILYAKYRDITMNILAHATWNSIVVILQFATLGR